MHMLLTIFLPCYNEEENIDRIPDELVNVVEKFIKSYEILIVDDGSKDNSINEIKKLQKKYKKIRLIRHKRNLGLGKAIRTGIKFAKGDLMVMLDCDFTFHPEQIKGLLDKFNKADVDCVSGSPYLAKGSTKDFPFYRILLSRAINKIYSLLLGERITATTPIFRLYKTKQLRELGISSSGYVVCAELLIKLLLKKRKVVEVPVILTTRKLGQSKINYFKEIKNHLFLLASIIAWKISRFFGIKSNI